MTVLEIPLAGHAYNMPQTQLDAQICKNWYVVSDELGKYKLSLSPRPGLSSLISDSSEQTTRGQLSLNDVLYYVVDNKLYAAYTDNSRELLGTLLTSVGYVKLITNDYQLLVCDGVYGYVYQIIEIDIYDAGEFFRITNASSTIETPIFVGTGIDDLTASGKYRGDVSTTYKVIIDGSNATIGAPVFNGSGLNDLTASGFYTGSTTITFRVQIDGNGTPDTFKYSINGGSTWIASTVHITGSDQLLQNGFKIKFNATTGHTIGNYWNITITVTTTSNSFKWSDDNGVTFKGTQVPITGSAQKLSDGVRITFINILGHTLGDLWEIPVTIGSSFFAPVYPAAQDGYGIYPQQNSNLIYISAINDFNTVDPLDYQAANIYPDNNVAAISVNQEVYIIKQETIEVWNDVGVGATAEAFPFKPRSSFVINYGCEAPFTVKAGSTNIICMLARNKNGSRMVVKIENYGAEVISTEPLNSELRSYSAVNDAFADIIEINNHIFYYITFPADDKTWVYDLTTKMWSEWSSYITPIYPNIMPHFGRFRGMFHSVFNGLNVVGDSKSGKIFKLDYNSFLDYDTPITFERISPHFSVENKLITINRIMIDMERGVAKVTGLGSNPVISLRISRDGGKTWGNELWRTSGEVGKYNHRALWDMLGTARQFTFRVRCTEPVFNVILGMIADIEVSE